MTKNEGKKLEIIDSQLSDIKKLVEIVSTGGISELEVEREGLRIKIVKNSPQQPNNGPHPVSIVTIPPQTASIPITPQEETTQMVTPPQLSVNEVTAEPVKKEKIFEVKSPMVGTLYRAPSPGADPFVRIGDRVRKGQVLCIIEAMKLMNEIESEVEGTITDILIENAKSVEYGETIIHIQIG